MSGRPSRVAGKGGVWKETWVGGRVFGSSFVAAVELNNRWTFAVVDNGWWRGRSGRERSAYMGMGR